MFQNYLMIAWRNLLKHKSFSFINILGLAMGISVCLIIFLYVHDELRFDLYNKKADRIARVTTRLHTPESDLVLATSPVLLGATLEKDYPEVESVARLSNVATSVKFNNDVFSETSFYKTDQQIFSVFSFNFLEGSPETALRNPGSIVVTETIARKYFGSLSALNKLLRCNGNDLQVTGVVKDRPANSDMKIDALICTDFSKANVWTDDFDHFTFVLFRGKPNLAQFSQKLRELSRKYVQPELDAGSGPGGAGRYKAEFEPEPLSSVHFSQGKLADMPKGNKQINYVFSLLAVFILIIALLNYINLSTVKSTERAREVGIRKVSGASRFQLIRQFIFESFFLLVIAFSFAIVLVLIGLPLINKFMQTKLSVNWPDVILFTWVIFFIALSLAGLYPAFVMSAFKPVVVLKGNWRNSIKGVTLRKVITVTQFAIAVALVMGTTVIFNQMKFISQKDLGFSKEQLLNIQLPGDSANRGAVKAFQNNLRSRPEVKGLTIGGGFTSATMSSTITNFEGNRREFMCVYFPIDPQFLPVFQIKLVAGRNISDQFLTDKQEAFLVNEAFLKFMGWKSGLGKSIEGWGHKGKIVGVVKNFYFKSLHDMIEPVALVYNTGPISTTTIKIRPGDLPLVKTLFKNNLPETPMDYSFIDEMVEKQYAKDRVTMSMFNSFTGLAIIISCLGLYGLVSLISIHRIKEISIRKVLGATFRQLLSLMTKDFLKLLSWSVFIALPVAGFIMNKWLSSYAYHISISWWMFFIPVVVIFLLALLVISKEIIRTALTNPVKSLRSE
jgi:putative ABC transport system permease protein